MQLTGFTYAIALNINMGYNTIRIDAKASEVCTVIFFMGRVLLPETTYGN